MLPMGVTVAATFCATLVDEWARAGVRHAVVAPGSRSTPLALALAADHRVAVHVHHDERLRGTHVVQLGRAVGGAHDHRDPGQVGLGHRGVQLDRRRATGRHHHRGTAGRQPEAEGQESRRPLVDVHVHPDALVPGQRHGQRRRPGPRSDDGIGDATPGELVDQGGAERRSHRRLVHGPGL